MLASAAVKIWYDPRTLAYDQWSTEGQILAEVEDTFLNRDRGRGEPRIFVTITPLIIERKIKSLFSFYNVN